MGPFTFPTFLNGFFLFFHFFLISSTTATTTTNDCTNTKTNYSPQLCLSGTPNNEWDDSYKFAGCDNDYPYYVNNEKTEYIIYSYNYENPYWYLYGSKQTYCICTESSLLNCNKKNWYCYENKAYKQVSSMILSACDENGNVITSNEKTSSPNSIETTTATQAPVLTLNKIENKDYCCHGISSTRDEYRCNFLTTKELCTDEAVSENCYWSESSDNNNCNIVSSSSSSTTGEIKTAEAQSQELCQCNGTGGNRKQKQCLKINNEATCKFKNCNWECV